MIQIDAHCDTGGSYEGCKFHHGGPFRQAVLDGVLDPSARSRSAFAAGPNISGSSLSNSGMTVIHAEEVDRDGAGRAWLKRTREVIGRRPDLCHLRRRQSGPRVRAGHGNAGGRRLEFRGRLGDPQGLSWSRRRRRRCCRSRAPIRPNNQYGADRRPSAIRRAVPRRCGAAASPSPDVCALSGSLRRSGCPHR